MRRGAWVGPEIEKAVVQMRRDYPRWGQQLIADEIAKKFPVTIHRSTVSNVLDRNGVPRSRRPGGGAIESESPREHSAQAERSGHWPALRKTGAAIASELSAPLPQLAVVPWNGVNDPLFVNEAVEVRLNGGLVITLAIEQDPLFGALRQHLRNHPVWKLLDDWKASLAALSTALRALVSLAAQEPEVREPRAGVTVSDRFPLLAALDALHQIEVPRLVGELIFEPSTRGESQELRWTFHGPSMLIARAPTVEPLGATAEAYSRLVERLITKPLTREAAKAHSATNMLRDRIEAELDQIALYVSFPGRCSLAPGRNP